MRKFLSVLLLFAVCLCPVKVNAEEAPHYASLCSVCTKNRAEDLSRLINRLEASYVRYRWIEAKIRRLYYKDIWAARYKAMDPLDKKKRREGERANNELESVLRSFEKEADLSANSVMKKISEIQTFNAHTACHPEHEVEQCLSETYTPIKSVLDSFKAEFDHIFETERDYRKAVSLTAGSKQGLYPQDALEKPVNHKEYFWRFEQERSPKRHDEDGRIIDFLNQLRDLADKKVAHSSCCVILEKNIEAPQ